MTDIEPSKAEIVARALERIAEGQYSVGADGENNSEIITIFDSGDTPEEYFAESLEKLRKIRAESATADNDLTLEADWSSENWRCRAVWARTNQGQ